MLLSVSFTGQKTAVYDIFLAGEEKRETLKALLIISAFTVCEHHETLKPLLEVAVYN